MRSGYPWGLASPFTLGNCRSEEQNPVYRGIAETFGPLEGEVVCQRCWPRGRAGLLDV